MSYYMADRKHRKAFLEARQSLEVKLNLEEQSQQQVKHYITFHSSAFYVSVFEGNKVLMRRRLSVRGRSLVEMYISGQ